MNTPKETIIYTKEIDKSLLTDGFTVPKSYHQLLKDTGNYPMRGAPMDVVISICGHEYNARLVNTNFTGEYASHSDVVQFRYSFDSPLSVTFKRIFTSSYNYIFGIRSDEDFKDRTHVVLPNDSKEYIVLKALETPGRFIVECHTAYNIIDESVFIIKDSSRQSKTTPIIMSNNRITIKLQHGSDPMYSKEGKGIQKISTSISPMTAIELIKVVDNAINPREAKAGPITKAIFKTLEDSPSLFWLKSKGVLLATTSCKIVSESEVELSFCDPQFEGIMDGGHNFLAIANFLVFKFFGDQLKTWKACKTYWEENYDAIVQKALAEEQKDDSIMRFSIPIEIISPVDEDTDSLDDYYKAIAEICSARNNNVQLKDSAKGNQEGYYEYLKVVLQDFPIIWKTNEAGTIKSEDVISWATLPLLYLQESGKIVSTPKLNEVNIYSSKKKCVQAFGEIISFDEYSIEENGKNVLTSPLIKSALDMTKDIMVYFDRMIAHFPNLFKAEARTKLATAAAKSVEKDKEMVGPFGTTDEKSPCTYPPAYIYPLVAGLTTMMKYNPATKLVEWKINPQNIDLSKLDLSIYVGSMKNIQYNPQNVGKGKLFYQVACNAYFPLLGPSEQSLF